MKLDARKLKPRKSPVQARSVATVDAIHEAAIQVLVAEGAGRLTTMRVAERAGVSIGTLYQYYPNKQSLMAAIAERHLARLTEAVELACIRHRGRPLAEMARAVAVAFMDAKFERPQVSRALYSVADEVGGSVIVARATARGLKAIGAMLMSAPDAKAIDLEMVSSMLLGAMVGPVRHLLETSASPRQVARVREHVILMVSAYLSATSTVSK